MSGLAIIVIVINVISAPRAGENGLFGLQRQFGLPLPPAIDLCADIETVHGLPGEAFKKQPELDIKSINALRYIPP